MQKIIAEVSIEIPKGYVLVKETKIQELEKMAEPAWAVGLEWFARQTSIGNHQTLKDEILTPYREELENIVDYPERRGELWRFNAYRVKVWLEDNFKKVNK